MFKLKSMAMVLVMAVGAVPLCAQSTLDLQIGVSGSFKYSCSTSSRSYYTIPIFHSEANHPLVSSVFQSDQCNCYENYESPAFPICYDGDTFCLMLAQSCDNSMGWRDTEVTNAMKSTSSKTLSHEKEAINEQADINYPGYPPLWKVQ